MLHRLPGKPQVLRGNGFKTPSAGRAHQIAKVPAPYNRNARRMPGFDNVRPDRIGLQCGMLVIHADELVGNDMLGQLKALEALMPVPTSRSSVILPRKSAGF